MQRELRFLLRFKSDAAKALGTTKRAIKSMGAAAKVASRGLTAVAAKLKQAAVGAAGFAKAAKTAGAVGQKVFGGLIRTAKFLATTLATVGVGFGLAGAVSTVAQFGRSMSRVQAITGQLTRNLDGTLNPTFEAVSETVRRLGATTTFTAGQAADAFGLLSQAGFSVAESIQAVGSVLSLAVVGSIDLASSATIVANSIRSFGLAADDAGRVADVFTATVTTANTDVLQLGEAMKFVGPIASSLGVSIEESAAAIGVLSDAGLKGTLAGTGLRRVMIGLAKQTPQAARALRGAGVDIAALKDAISGKGGGLVKALERFEGRTLDAAQAVDVFGLRGGPAFLVLQKMAEKAGSLSKAFEDVQGRAKEFADVAKDNLAGDLKILKSVIDDVVLGTGTLNESLREVVQTTTGVIQALVGTLDPLDKDATRFRMIAETVSTAATAVEGLVVAFVGFKILRGVALGIQSVAIALGLAKAGTLAETAALIGLRGAILATGVGALALGVTAVAAAFFKWSRETSDTDKILASLNDTLDADDKVLERVKGKTGELALTQLPSLTKAVIDTQKKVAALAGKMVDLNAEADKFKRLEDAGLFEQVSGVIDSDTLTTFDKFRSILFGLDLASAAVRGGFNVAGEAAGIFEGRIEDASGGVADLTTETAKMNEELNRLASIKRGEAAITSIGNKIKSLANDTDEIQKALAGFSGSAAKGLTKLKVQIGDLSLGTGGGADLQRKINAELRSANLEVVLPVKLSSQQAAATDALTAAEKQLVEARRVATVEGVKGGEELIANAEGQVEVAKRALASVRDTIAERAKQREELVNLVTTKQNQIEANKRLLEQQKKMRALRKGTAKSFADARFEVQLLGLSKRERAANLRFRREQNKADAAGLPGLTDEQRELLKIKKINEDLARTDVFSSISSNFKDFVDESTNSAMIIGDSFKGMLDGISTGIADAINKGTFNFRSFAASIVEELTNVSVKLAVGGVFKKIADNFPGKETMGATGTVAGGVSTLAGVASGAANQQVGGEMANPVVAAVNLLRTSLSSTFTAGLKGLGSVFQGGQKLLQVAVTALGPVFTAGSILANTIGAGIVSAATTVGSLLVQGAILAGNAILTLISIFTATSAAKPTALGGVAGSRGQITRRPPSGLQRFAAGGIPVGIDTIPALLAPGERVLSRSENKAFEASLRTQGEPMIVNVKFDIQTNDVAGFNKSRSQIEESMQEALTRAMQRNG